MYRFKCQYCGRVNKDVRCEGCGYTGEFVLPRINVSIDEERWEAGVAPWRCDFVKLAQIPDDLYVSCLSL